MNVDYNGVVNTTDFNFISSNFNQVLPAPLPGDAALGTLVPEPGIISLACLGVSMLSRRRRIKG